MSKIIDKNDEIYKDLTSLGLDQNEALTYLSLLKLGEVGASKIVRDTGLHGQTIYDALYKLEEKSLIRFNLVNGRKKFLAQSPSFLVNLIENKRNIANQITEKIEKRFSSLYVQDIEILKGKDSFVSNEFKHLMEIPDNSELLILGGPATLLSKIFGNQFNEYDYQRNKKNIKVRYIGGVSQKKYLDDSANQRRNFQYKILPDVFSGITNITIFKNHAVLIYLFDETVTTIVLNNKKITESYVGFFESLWSIAK